MFHYVRKGHTLIFDSATNDITEAKEGEIVFINSSSKHFLVSDRESVERLKETEYCERDARPPERERALQKFAHTTIVCGQIGLPLPAVRVFTELLRPIVRIKKSDMTETQRLLVEAMALSSSSEIDEGLFCRLTEAFLITILRRTAYSGRNSNKGLDALVSHIHRHYGEPIAWEVFIKASKLSRATFFRKFKDRVGMSPNEYLGHVRMKKARVLLETTSLPIKVVCGLVGFKTPASFSKKYRGAFGAPPGQVRKRDSAQILSQRDPVPVRLKGKKT